MYFYFYTLKMHSYYKLPLHFERETVFFFVLPGLEFEITFYDLVFFLINHFVPLYTRILSHSRPNFKIYFEEFLLASQGLINHAIMYT